MKDYLFSKIDLHSVTLNQDKKLSLEISNLSQDQILRTVESELVEYFFSKYKINPIVLDLENITIDPTEIDIDVSQDPMRAVFDRSRPAYVRGNRIQYFIPYSGDKELFFCRPSTSSSLIPFGEVRENEIILTIDTLEKDAVRIKELSGRNILNIQQYVSWVNGDISGFNNSLNGKITSYISNRKEKLDINASIVNSLGYPLRRRENSSQTYTVPAIKKKIIPIFPQIKSKNIKPEPVLDIENYDLILKTLSDMSLMMERSPQTFTKLKEEEIRDHFLMVLNSQFEGSATGETFNYEGKTDVLIRVENKNIFIAECKFWKGEKVLLETIDQLLGYLSWRDTKTAILLFNKNKEFSKVVSQVLEIVKKHSNFIKETEYESETGFRFLLHHKDDKDREFLLTILLFNIP